MKIVDDEEELSVRPIVDGKLIKVRMRREEVEGRIEGRKGR